MLKIFLVITIILSFTSCNSSSTKPISGKGENKEDSLQTIVPSLKAKYYSEIEKSILDSIADYGLDSINERCEEMLYVLYARDTIIANKENNIITIGECNIRLFNFQSVADNLKYIHYGFYINDSTSVNWYINQKQAPNIVKSFEVDVKKKKITRALISEHVSMQITDIEKAFDSIKVSNGFKNYLLSYKGRLHPNFKLR